MNKKTKTHLLILAAYLFLTLVFTYPLGIHLNSHIPAYGKGGDAHSFIWNSWNFKQMLESGAGSPLTTSYLLIPFQPNLSFHTYTLFRNVLVLMLSWFVPFITAFNLVTLFMFIASGFGAYLLTLRFCKNPYAAFISGMIFSFAPFKLARLMAHYNFVDSACLPFFILMLFLALEKKKAGYAVGAGVLLALIGYSSYYYLIFTFVFLGLLVLYSLFFKQAMALYGFSDSAAKSMGLRERFISLFQAKFFFQLGIVGLVLVVLFSPILLNILKYEKDYLVEKKVFGKSPDLMQFVTPAPRSLLNTYLIKAEDYGTEKVIFLGFVVILLSLYSLSLIRGKPNLGFWWGTALIFMLLSLGSELIVGGQRLIGLPYQLLHSLPILSGARNPSRYIIFTMLALGILSACSLENILLRLKKTKWHRIILPLVSALCLVLICSEYLTAPLRMFDLTPHDFYKTIAADDERYSLLEIPFSISGKGKSFGSKERLGLYQYYQTVHNKNLASGWLANLPDKIFEYYRKNEFIQKICYLQEKQGVIPEQTWDHLLKPDPLFKEYLTGFNIKYILIHRGAVKADAIDNLARYFSSHLSGSTDYTVRRREGIIRFTLMDAPPDPPLGENLLLPKRDVLLTEGWSNWTQYQGSSGRWGVNSKLVLLFSSPRQAGYRLSMDLELPAFFQTKRQILEVSLNSQKISQIEITGRMEKDIALEPELLAHGTNVLQLKLKNMESIKKDASPHYSIGTTGCFSPVDIQAVSLSRRLPFEGRIMFPGLRIGNPAQRFSLQGGYNIFVVDEISGQVIESSNFKTNTSRDETEKLAVYLDSLRSGRIVIALTWDDAARQLTAKAVEALGSIGAGIDIRDHPSACHAVIGVKGAAPGEAMEMVDAYTSVLDLGNYSNADKVGLWFHRIELRTQK